MALRYCKETQEQVLLQVLRGLNELLNTSGYGQITVIMHDKVNLRVEINAKGETFQGVLEKKAYNESRV